MTNKEYLYNIYLVKKNFILERGEILKISEEQARAIRRKQADNMLTAKEASKEIGINPITFKRLTQGGEFKNTVYQKAMQWLAKDY